MRMITVHLTEFQLTGIEKLIDMHIFPNRSEAIRVFIREGIKAQFEFIAAIDAKSRIWESIKECLEDKDTFKIRGLLANYLLEEFGVKPGLGNEQFDSIRVRISHIIAGLEKRGFVKKEASINSRYLYRIINRKFLE